MVQTLMSSKSSVGSSAVSTSLVLFQDTEQLFKSWAGIAMQVASLPFSGRYPVEDREHLKSRFDEVVEGSSAPLGDFLALLFGSFGRAEPARDLDLLVVIRSPLRWFRYERISARGRIIDLNIASLPWLDEAWADPEWGYCLSEAYVLRATSFELEESLGRAVARFWTAHNRSRRSTQHLTFFRQLAQSSDRAKSLGLDAVSRLLGHEAIRSAAISLIDQFGTRVYSHRSFISEVRHSCRRAGLDARLIETVISGLSTSSPRTARIGYIAVREKVSQIFRGLPHTCGVEYDPAATKVARVAVLKRLASVSLGGRLELLLEQIEVDSWLPNADRMLEACRAAEAVVGADPKRLTHIGHRLVEAGSATSANVRFASMCDDLEAPSPERNAIPGARWVEMAAGRLKLILSTGGCKTPTCLFCSLPAYGARSGRRPPAEPVAEMLRRYHPRELALYNDGSLLNPAEVSRDELRDIWTELRHAHLDRLWIESIPRFVTESIMIELLEETGAAEVVVGMGFQCTGNWAAVDRLGRPDTDSVFERAIEVLHRLGVKVRLYLLWGHPAFELSEWSNLLRASARWAVARRVERITICPFVTPLRGELEVKVDRRFMCELRTALAGVPPNAVTAVEVALPAAPSCGMKVFGGGCKPCVESLQTGDWARHITCNGR